MRRENRPLCRPSGTMPHPRILQYAVERGDLLVEVAEEGKLQPIRLREDFQSEEAIYAYPRNLTSHATDSREPVTKVAHLLVTNARKGERKERQGGRSFLQEFREASLLLVVIRQREFRDSLTNPQDQDADPSPPLI